MLSESLAGESTALQVEDLRDVNRVERHGGILGLGDRLAIHLTPMTRTPSLAFLLLATALGTAAADENAPYTVEGGNKVDARTFAAWQAVRQIDCARCHGADWNGSVGPPILPFVKSQTKESFMRIVLEGNPSRGMPGYKGTPKIADNIEAIYGYFKGVAAGEITVGKLEELK